MNRKLERDVRRLQDRAKGVLQEKHAHWYESYPPLGSTISVLFADDFDIHLYPIRLHDDLDLRVVSLRARSLAGAGECSFATAVYRATRPVSQHSDDADDPPGRFPLRLLGTIASTYANPTDITTFHHRLSSDLPVTVSPPCFLAIQVGDASNTEFYAPASNSTPDVGYVSTHVGTRLGDFPFDIGVDTTTRALIPHFILRSAYGARLWGDPVSG